jgi:hypothetical protein
MLVRTFSPHANNVTATGVAEALTRCRMPAEVRFKTLEFSG